METYCLRLTPGQDLKQELQTFAHNQGLEAGIILTALGSLTQASLRFAAAPEATVIDGPLELLSLSGTLSRHGMHLHGAIADAQGQAYGGHIMPGCLIRTTAEIAIANLPHLRLHRQPDSVTGYLELAIDVLS
ncbi:MULTISPECIES: PPC domain-containing DNA-binding protein [Cyanophyceae]|uniref:PPC domain-containing DNA-binding protein n=1 Tax=Cyanophyceae TaxID=3028117 RepID=UPI001687F89F|nr:MULTISPECIES: PPC domain-containing DNA-binding protein [Cyanophyceae]MBD1916121.1 DNA-binding protein [Phormidium sp. FACHB-77]MBD2031610.1 DNA-binding protein [Phormidium sp. FACHB-322]MBD2052763.1 DNA-binding protein [Leptolyngbya sp. FACHB-60]